MKLNDFDFEFPPELIALAPRPRGEARLLALSLSDPEEHWSAHTRDLPEFLQRGDALVLNDSRVIPARLLGRFPSGGKVEVLLLQADPPGDTLWQAMVKPGKRCREGVEIHFPEAGEKTEPGGRGEATVKTRVSARVVATREDGTRILEFDWGGEDAFAVLERLGKVPLPPYIRREPRDEDVRDYQCVFARTPGSVAAPTAGLHWSEEMLARAEERGVHIVRVTLHVGAGTFRPVQSENIADHVMHSERYHLSNESAAVLNRVRSDGGRIIAVGTTAARVLESCVVREGDARFRAGGGETSIYIRSGHVWRGVDGLLTNFHWPRSSLFILVCSLLGVERAQALYQKAFRKGFRLFSYGDAMLIQP